MFGHTNEPVTITRDVKAIIIPAGEELTLREGTTGFLTQALGGSFTVYVEGNLFRIAGGDADALGKLRTCYDPEIPVNIVDLGLIYRCEVKPLGNGERSVEVDMTLTAPGCGMGEILVQDAQEKIGVIPTVADVQVYLVFDPPWNQSMMSEEARLQTGLM
jgi:metal-sulfur cluster biosynthetic enzyme